MAIRWFARAVALLCVGSSLAFSPAVASAKTPLVPPGWPTLLTIPRFGVRAPVERLALTAPADAHAPYRWGDVAWYDRGPRPGDRGRATIYGHVDSYCCPAVFWNLRNLKAGDLVRVSYRSGKPLTFRVLWKGMYRNQRVPQKWMYGPTTERGLVLITCAGIFQPNGIGYDHKLLVYTRLVLPNGHLG